MCILKHPSREMTTSLLSLYLPSIWAQILKGT